MREAKTDSGVREVDLLPALHDELTDTSASAHSTRAAQPQSPKPRTNTGNRPHAPARSRTWIYRLGGTIAGRARGLKTLAAPADSASRPWRENPRDTPRGLLSGSGERSTGRCSSYRRRCRQGCYAATATPAGT